MNQLHENIETVLGRIGDAARAAGRVPEEIILMGASKKQDPERIDEAVQAGLCLFGENRIQEAKQKIPLCSSRAQWEFIGHLQTNKVREAVAFFSCIQSVDSSRLAAELDQEADKQGKVLRVCVEINVGGEGAKHGLLPENAESEIELVARMRRLELVGLMTVPPFTVDPEGSRPYFAKLREMRDRLEIKLGLKLPVLSMGMSHDYVQAVAEGSTLVRVGTAIFGGRS